MKSFCLCILLFHFIYVSAQFNADLLIRNGRILDGSGNSWYHGEIAIRDGRIIKIGKDLQFSAIKIIDAKDHIVSPGFIDVHTHIEGNEIKIQLPTILYWMV